MENSAADIDDDRQKNPAEKMRVRLAAEGYDGRYKPMDDSSDDEQSGWIMIFTSLIKYTVSHW